MYKVLLTNTQGPVEDPDVVMDAGGNTGNAATTTQTLVTYLAAGHVYVEVWRFDATTSTATKVRDATRIDTGTGTCTSPNVDANRYGQAVVVYEQGGQIKARAVNISGTNNGAISTNFCTVATNTTGLTYSEPDVAVFRNANYSADPSSSNATFVFLADNGSGKSVQARRIPYAQVTTLTFNGPGTTIYTGSGQNSAPRIAAPWEMNVFSPNDFQIVFQNLTASTTDIVGATAYAAAGTSLTSGVLNIQVLNSTAGINASNWHERPVVSYAGDNIITAWSELDLSVGFDYNIIARRQAFDGTLVSSSYSYVNQNTSGDQRYPSIAGRFSSYGTGASPLTATGQGNGEAFYSFFDANKNDILYKNSYYSNSSLRGTVAPTPAPAASPAPASPLAVYPNPAPAGQATIAFALAEREQALSLEILDRLGRSVQTLPVQTLGTGTHQLRLDGTGLKPGMYIIRLRTSSGPAQAFRLAVD